MHAPAGRRGCADNLTPIVDVVCLRRVALTAQRAQIGHDAVLPPRDHVAPFRRVGAEPQPKEAEARRIAEEERKAREPKVVGNFGDDRTLTPIMSSPDITPEEQEAIATWVNLMRMAQPTMPADLVVQ